MTGHASPYVGLVPYSEADAELFFGREREQRIIAANLRASRLTLLYGASGVGKSSVLLAGVLPELHRMVATSRNAAARMRNGRGSTAVADRAPLAVAVMREWRDPPLPRLAEAIRAAVIEACGDDDVAPWVPGTPLVDTLRGYAARVRTLLVILDQFEEYFLYHQEAGSPGSFDAQFAAVANDPDLRVNVMLSLREDALSQLDRFKGRIPGLFANYLRVDYLDRESARIAVTEPIAAYNHALGEGAPQSTIADDLIEQVLDDVRTGQLAFGESQAPAQSNGAPPVDDRVDRVDRVETPYLQLVMERLWTAAAQPDGRHALTLSTLRDLGGAEAIVSSHLTEAMGTLSAADENLAATVFQFLVTPSKTKIAHRASDLAFWAKRPAADVSRVLDQLAGERRIVRSLPPPPGEDEGRYEIFHDVLAEAVLEWCASQEAERERTALATKLREEDRARRKARRDRILRRLAVVLGLVIVGLLVLLIPALIQRSETQAEERRTRSTGLAAAASGQIAVDPERAVLIAQQALAEADTSRAREALASAVAASHVLARMGHQKATACGSMCRPGPTAATWSPRPAALTSSFYGQVQHISFTPDGRRVGAVVNGKVRIWEPETGDDRTLPRIENASAARIAPDGNSVLVLDTAGVASVASLTSNRVWRVPGTVSSVALSPDGRFVASVSFSGEVIVRHVDGPDPLRRLPPRGFVQSVEFSPVDPQQILVSAAEHVSLWRWRTSSTPRTLLGKQPRAGAGVAAAAAVVPAAPAPAAPAAAVPAAAPGATSVTMARFSPDGQSVAVVERNGRARVVGVAPVKRYRRTPRSQIYDAIFSPGGSRLLTVEGRTATLRTASGRALSTLAGHAAAITSAGFSPDGRLVATGSSDGTARVWNAESGNQTLELRGHGAAVTDVAFSPDGRRLLTDGEDGTTRLWDVSAGDVLHVSGWYGAPVAAPRADGKVTVLNMLSGVVRAWTPGAGTSRPLAKYGMWLLYAGAISSDGEHVAMTGEGRGRALVVRDLGTRESKPLARRPVDLLALSPDGRRLFTLTEYYGRRRGVARVYDTASGEQQKLARTELPPDAYSGIVWGPANRVLLTSYDGPARILDATTGRTLQAFWGHLKGAGVGTASQRGGFSPDGRLVVTAGARQALVWRANTAQVTAHLQGHTAALTDAAFSPNGRWIVTGDEAGTIRIWDPATERSLAELPSHGAPVASVAFTPTNRQILSTAEDGTVRLDPCVPCVSPEELRSLAEDRVTRDLTRAERRAYLGESR